MWFWCKVLAVVSCSFGSAWRGEFCMPDGLGGLRGSSLSGGLLSHEGSSQSALCTCMKLICSNGVTTVKRVPVEQQTTQLKGGNGKQTRKWELRTRHSGSDRCVLLFVVCLHSPWRRGELHCFAYPLVTLRLQSCRGSSGKPCITPDLWGNRAFEPLAFLTYFLDIYFLETIKWLWNKTILTSPSCERWTG